MIKPMLRKGYYVSPLTTGEFHYAKVTCETREDGLLEIMKGPEAINTRDGYIVVSPKTVYKVTIHDFFRGNVPAAARLSVDDIESGFIKYSPSATIRGLGAGPDGSTDTDSETEDDIREANKAIENQVQVLFS